MGWFSKQKSKNTFKDIVSAVLLEQTQLYQQKSNWGVTFGGGGLLDGQIIAMDGGQVPAGSVLTFSVTYRDGSKEILKERSGTERCNRLLQIALDPALSERKAHDKGASADKNSSFELRKNQLPNGEYLIGRDIPAGTYDFTCVFGYGGDIMKFENDHDTTLGATTYFQNVGTQYDYESSQCLNVKCTEGELLKIHGNIVVEISKSKKVEIDL